MQQRPENRGIDSIRMKRTQPALPGVTLPTTPIPGVASPTPPSPSQARKKQHTEVLIPLQLLGLGVLLEVLYLALYPLLANATSTPDTIVKHAIPGIFPWVTEFYWTTKPLFSRLFVAAAWLNPTTDTGRANLVLLILALACVLALLAVRLGGRVARERGVTGRSSRIFWVMLLLTGIFSVTMLCIPIGLNALSHDMLLYGLYGRVVMIYHFNPYVAAPSLFSQDVLQSLIKARETTPYGPVWTDVSLLITIFAHDSIASMLLGFRLVGLIAHLASTALLWAILTRLRPERRLPLTLLYAWNPVVLLLGVCYMHLEMVIVLFLLLAGFFFQRNAPLLAWVFVLLTALINPLYLLLLPLFLHMMMTNSRLLPRRFLRWLSVASISGLVVVLAYAPYWQDWGLTGLVASLHRSFLPDNAVNSLDAMLLHLPVQLPPALVWLAAPHHWTAFALSIVSCIFLFGLWLADTEELVFLFSSWLLLALAVLMPGYWPWYVIPPLALALCSTSIRTTLLTLMLVAGGLISLYCWLLPSLWMGLALVTVGLPVVLWGWALFFNSSWRMTRAKEIEQAEQQKRQKRRPGISRPPWLSRPPSWGGD